MATEVTTLELNARLTNAEQTIAGLQRMGQAGKQVETSFGAMGKQILGFGTAAGAMVVVGQKVVSSLVDMGKQSVVLAANFEKARMTWGVLVGDMAKGSQMFDNLFAFAAKTPLSFQGVNQAATTLKAYGVATDQLIPTMRILGDVAMGDNQKLAGMSIAYGQIMSTGRLMGQDLLQLINQGFNPLQVISQKTGESMIELKKRMEQGGVSSQEVAEAFKIATAKGGQFYGMMDKTAETTAGKWSTAIDNFKLSLSDLGTRVLPLVNAGLDTYNRLSDFNNSTNNILSSAFGRNMDPEAIKRAISDTESRIKGYRAAGTDKGNVQATIFEDYLQRQKAQLAVAEEMAREARRDKSTYGRQNAVPGEGPTPFVSAGYLPSLESGPSSQYMDKKARPTYDEYFNQPTSIVGQGVNIDQRYRQAPIEGYHGAYIKNSGLLGLLDDMSGLRAGTDEIKQFDQAVTNLGKSLEGIASSDINSMFDSIGKSLAAGASGAQTFEQSMSQIGASAASQTGQLMTTLGLQLLIESGGANPVGWALLAGGGILDIVGGAWSASNSSSSNGTSTGASAADMAALTAYYQKTEAFNAQGRNRVLGYASGTNYAMGGWAWVGERGPELMRVPSGAQIIPNHRIPGYAGGLNTPSLGNMTVNILPPSGYEAVQSETNGPDGRAVEVAFRRIVRDEMGRASAQQAARSGRRVTG